MKTLAIESRFVVLVPRLGISIKLPRIHTREILTELKILIRRKQWRELCIFLFSSVYQTNSLSNLLFRGVLANQSEFEFYYETRNPFVWPTYYSLWGILNIQGIGRNIERAEMIEVFKIVIETSGDEIEDWHIFVNEENYRLSSEGKIYLAHYATQNCQHVLAKYGTELREQLQY